MNILICSVPFRPSVGSIETVSALLAERFHRLGHRMVLVTQTAFAGTETEGFEVVRRPGPLQLLSPVHRADVVFHTNICPRFPWPQLLLTRPWVVTHYALILLTMWAVWVKRFVLGYVDQIAVSRAVADSVPSPSRPRLTVIGKRLPGPALRRLPQRRGIAEQVGLSGHRFGSELLQALRAHRTLVMPSVREEPFGVRALEAIACECAPVVACSGGLPDATDACGLVLPLEDGHALARGMGEVVGRPAVREQFWTSAVTNLNRRPYRVARDYLTDVDDAHRSHAQHRA